MKYGMKGQACLVREPRRRVTSAKCDLTQTCTSFHYGRSFNFLLSFLKNLLTRTRHKRLILVNAKGYQNGSYFKVRCIAEMSSY